MDKLETKIWDMRMDILDIILGGKTGHIGGDMSVLEAMASIYDRMNISPDSKDSPDRDRFVLSKGHCVEALYTVLSYKGFLDINEVKEQYSRFGSVYIGHPNNKIPGIEMNSGSLGHGLGLAVGMALAGKMDKRSYRVYTIMGDGELAEGSVWEAAMSASNYNLDNLCAVVDRNGLQISGSTEDVMKQENLTERFKSFGWNVIDVQDGNSVSQLNKALDEAENTKNMPTLIIAHTIKGYGSPVMENKAEWHHKVPNNEEAEIIRKDFLRRKEAIAQ